MQKLQQFLRATLMQVIQEGIRRMDKFFQKQAYTDTDWLSEVSSTAESSVTCCKFDDDNYSTASSTRESFEEVSVISMQTVTSDWILVTMNEIKFEQLSDTTTHEFAEENSNNREKAGGETMPKHSIPVEDYLQVRDSDKVGDRNEINDIGVDDGDDVRAKKKEATIEKATLDESIKNDEAQKRESTTFTNFPKAIPRDSLTASTTEGKENTKPSMYINSEPPPKSTLKPDPSLEPSSVELADIKPQRPPMRRSGPSTRLTRSASFVRMISMNSMHTRLLQQVEET